MGLMGIAAALCKGYKHSDLKLRGYVENKEECLGAGVEFKELRKGIGFEPRSSTD